MFLGRVGQFLGLQLLQGADNAETRVARFDNIIDIAILGCIVRLGKQLRTYFRLVAKFLTVSKRV